MIITLKFVHVNVQPSVRLAAVETERFVRCKKLDYRFESNQQQLPSHYAAQGVVRPSRLAKDIRFVSACAVAIRLPSVATVGNPPWSVSGRSTRNDQR